MFAGRSGSTPIFLVSLLAVLLQFIVLWRKSINLAEPPGRVEFRKGRVILDDRPLPRSSLLWSKSARLAVHKHLISLPDTVGDDKLLQRARASSLAAQHSGFDCWAGVLEGKDFHLDFASLVHMLIIGPTGSGKSQFLSLVLNSLFASRARDEVRVILIDFKGSALLASICDPSRFETVIDDLDRDSHQEFWTFLHNELETRERFERAVQTKPAIAVTAHPVRLFVVVDELSAVLKSSPKASDVLVSLATRGRSLGIHLVLTNQGLSGIPRELLLNLKTRVAMQATDQVELVQLGASSRKIFSAQTGWASARVIRNDYPEIDFRFPIGTRLRST